MEAYKMEDDKDVSTLQIDYFSKDGGRGMPHYHVHDYYEISLILNGSMRILLEDATLNDRGSFLLLAPPGALHRVARDSFTTYERINLVFPKGYVENYVADSGRLLSAFGAKGRILTLSDEQREHLYTLADELQAQPDPFRQRLLFLFYLAEIEHLCNQEHASPSTPSYIARALQFLHQNYAKKLTAEQVAWQVGVGRTTLMTAFKQYTGSTLNHYLTQYRLQMALNLLKQGQTQQSAAEQSGFSDAGSFIRAFTRHYGTTPYKYLRS